ncbi:ABC transporter ATP-binding protein [Streptomyces johnsoniae]|uniref:ATP-binding cassette domain-containing protein n=1 Tax=Streptomyces johnsoniae TaxID=3075532 RepID=A0ABU2S0N7_9ACTN|nr:ATP-binding cassette domain-containing protein [Streptomyces sp. DSM 41886]MDT0441314.1 ATP-binding cassette domain-containing protein [Streptomyces sp. DSM 41886]
MAPAPILTTHDLARTFETKHGTVEAVRGIDMHVERGEILGFLGPNGAGKSTTLKMLTTLLAPTRGRASVDGLDLAREPAAVRRRIGYVAQTSGTDPNETVHGELVFQGRLYGLARAEATARAEEVADGLGLGALRSRTCAQLSGGQKRRLDIALALVHRPALLFLDEPTTGLDPGSRADLWDLIRHVRGERGTTVFLTTHYLDEADALADRLVVVDGGRVVAEGTPHDLKTTHGGSPEATLQDTFIAITGRGPRRDEPAPVAV